MANAIQGMPKGIHTVDLAHSSLGIPRMVYSADRDQEVAPTVRGFREKVELLEN